MSRSGNDGVPSAIGVLTTAVTLPAPVPQPSPAAEWLLLGAALLHLWEVEGHGRVWWGYGVFFLLIVLGQAAYSLLLPRYGARNGFLLAGVVANLALVGLWAWTRTVGGVPVGPHRHVEAVGPVDLTTMSLQLLAVALLVVTLLQRRRAAVLVRRPPGD